MVDYYLISKKSKLIHLYSTNRGTEPRRLMPFCVEFLIVEKGQIVEEGESNIHLE